MPARFIRAHLVCGGRTDEGKPCPGARAVDRWPELRNDDARAARKCPSCARPSMRVARTEQVTNEDAGEA